ncbi:translocation/assembly module TamB domain-containing protein [Paludibacter sp.]
MIIVIASPFILLKFNKIQNYVANIITTNLSEKIKTNITIGRVDYSFFNKLRLTNVLIEDQSKDTLLFAKDVNVGLVLRKLIKNEIVFSQIAIDQMSAIIAVDSLGKTNADFLFKKSDTPKDSTHFELQLRNVVINNSYVSYTKQNKNKKNKNGQVSFSHTIIKDVNTELALPFISNDSINLTVNHLSANTDKGFKLNNFKAQVIGNSQKINIPKFTVSLPESKLNFDGSVLLIDTTKNSDNLFENISVNLPITNSTITLSDLSSFAPELSGIQESVHINTVISGKLSNLRFKEIDIKLGKTIALNANIDINGLPNIKESFIYAHINGLQASTFEVQDLISKLNKKRFVLPKEVHKLGKILYKGNITGFLSDLVAYGNINTNIGSVSSDIALQFENNLMDLSYNGKLKTNGFLLGKMLNDTTFGKISIDMNTKGTKIHNQPIKGTIVGELKSLIYKSYNYKNAKFDGAYDGTGFNGKFNIKDENIDADFLGIIDFKDPKIPIFDFELNIANTNFYALHLIEKYPNSKISFHGKTNLSGSNLDNLNGNLVINDIIFYNGDKALNANDIVFSSRTDQNLTHFSIKSDYINGSFSGNFKYSTIGKTFQRILSNYLPALSENNGDTQHLPNTVNINLEIENTNEISQILDIPYQIDGSSSIKGVVNETANKIDVAVKIDALKTEKQIFEKIALSLENKSNKILFTGRTQMHDKNAEMLNVFLSSEAVKDNVSAKLIWQNNQDVTNAGEINTQTTLLKKNNSLQAHTVIQPSQVIISDSEWNIHKSELHYYSDSLFVIKDFLFERDKQFIRIDGTASKSDKDSLVISMNELDLDYLMQLIRLRGIQFSGIITGEMKLFSLLKQPIYLADLKVQDFSLNEKIISDAILTSTWDKDNNQLLINGDFTSKNNEKVAFAKGVYVPKNDSLDISVDAKKFPVDFLNTYFEGIADNFKGIANGNLRIFGPTKNILFEGELSVSQGQASINMLNTTYRFNDKIILTPYRIHLNKIRLLDEYSNTATLNGHLDHNGSFLNMKYDVSINSNNILALNTTAKNESFFYGRAFVGGLVHIFGNDKEANIVVNGASNPRTKCYMTMGNASSVMETDFIHFVNKKIYDYYKEKKETKKEFVNQTPFNVKVDMQVEVTPEAEMEILVDPKAGDKITGRGRGDIRIKFDSFSDVDLYGTVELDQGYYLFTLQTVIRKEFKINEGSTIAWTGDPFGAQVNITGYYPLTASLSDLLEADELKQFTSRSTIPVHCLLHLTDDLMSPTIQFDIDLPSSDESVKSRVKSIINTEEMMNRQILYLMLFHRFFAPENIRATNAGLNEGISFAMASASSQINSYLQNILNSNVISLGFDWQKADMESDEVKAQILIQPNNRLVINGNIGYRNDNINENKIFGDFDLEYKLVESGRLRFTAYNHTIDRAQLREAKTTQGVGLMYREDFNTVPEMFVYYWDLVKELFKKKEKKK